ncbi:unnamed protein product [Didymodactylos carnosus]|uniref:JNK1/MAPK8-associated membrane protein n=1 Tax=Didymodactylos carnosus TaxID=1234261 RepID=A0A814UBR1_9BILA|nr:unnamed protein product [Didymodactylos carnosus]CAF1171417.1 unnamed protein product [Didymodactylos carnosus]CAF3744658.1 unnamed protein product [Didymodactylos carnosus]CAF3935294.1 unnamed protein product [Didymodactylos carnosus]
MSTYFIQQQQKSPCPGKYCGIQDNSTTCGACTRGYRSENGICLPCEDSLSLYNVMYLCFMTLLALICHWGFFTYSLRKQKDLSLYILIRLSTVYVLSFVELSIAFLLTLLVFPPYGKLNIHVCQIKMLSDFYPVFYNPVVNYTKKLRCSYEVVYPLQSAVFVLYIFATLLMLLLRPFLIFVLYQKNVYHSIYTALHFYPCLMIFHAIAAGLIYFSFPILTIVSAIIFNAVHFTHVGHTQQKWFKFVRLLRGDVRNWICYCLHVILLLCGLISLTKLESLKVLLAFAFVPAPLYILLWKFAEY